ncbi:unnamed protein product [Lampetra fluviatilis]
MLLSFIDHARPRIGLSLTIVHAGRMRYFITDFSTSVAQNTARPSSSRARGKALNASSSVQSTDRNAAPNRRVKALQSPPAAVNSLINGNLRGCSAAARPAARDDTASAASHADSKMAAVGHVASREMAAPDRVVSTIPARLRGTSPAASALEVATVLVAIKSAMVKRSQSACAMRTCHSSDALSAPSGFITGLPGLLGELLGRLPSPFLKMLKVGSYYFLSSAFYNRHF